MNIQGLGSASQTAGLQSTHPAWNMRLPTSQPSTSSDSASFSPAAMAALMQSQSGQGGGMQMPQMTDDMAAKIGEDIKKQSPDLFKALDTDNSGTLTAAKLEAGKDKIMQAMQDGTLQPPQDGQFDAGSDAPQITDDLAAKIGDKIKEKNADLFKQLDADEDGKLSAKELEAGKDKIKSAMKAHGMGDSQPGGGPHGAKGGGGAGAAGAMTSATSSSSDSDSTTEEINALHKQGLSNAEIASRLGKTEAQVKQALTSA